MDVAGVARQCGGQSLSHSAIRLPSVLLPFAPLGQRRRARCSRCCSAVASANLANPTAVALTASNLGRHTLTAHQWAWGVRSIWVFSSPLTYALLGLCCLPLGAVMFGLAKVVWDAWESRSDCETAPPPQEERTLYGVDVSSSKFLMRPKIVEAADFAARAHRGQTRRTRDPYIMHCIETALIVEQLICNVYQATPYPDDRIEEAIQVALLHDVTDDTAMNISDVEQAFGSEIAEMVRKVSQLSTLNQLLRRRKRQEAILFQGEEEKEQLRDLVLSMVGKPLVIVIKLADRLHNMRTVYALKPDRARAVAAETRQLWCSLAERLGILPLKSELEDLCMAVLEPATYRKVYEEVGNLWGPQQDGLAAFNELSGSDSRSSQEAALQERRASSATAGTSAPSTSAQQQAVDDAVADLLRIKGPRRKGRTVRMSITPAMMNAVWAARRMTGAAVGARSVPQPQYASAFASTSSYDDGGSSSGLNSIPSNPRTGRTLHTRREWNEKKRVQRALQDAIDAQATIDIAAEKDMPWLSEEQRQVKEELATVPPFHTNSFKGQLHSTNLRRKLGTLEQLGRKLLIDASTDSYAPGLQLEIEGRLKSVASIHRKMTRKNVPLSEVYDTLALRVLVDDEDGRKQDQAVEACYALKASVERIWKRIPREADDYIANPKGFGGYQSLHTAVKGPDGQPFEVQIRTISMHRNAEYGKAAHWMYKETGAVKLPSFSSSSPVSVGQPVLRVDRGRRTQGVVLRTEQNGRRLIVVVCKGERLPEPEPGKPESLEPYKDLQEMAEVKGWFQAGHGNLSACLEEFTLCSDGNYHRIDHLGHIFDITVVPYQAWHIMQESAPAAAASASPPETSSEEMQATADRIRRFRDILEWGHVAPFHSAESAAEGSHVHIFFPFPAPGHFHKIPKGTTAGEALRQEVGPLLGKLARINVNNELVASNTILSDGDYLIPGSKLIQI